MLNGARGTMYWVAVTAMTPLMGGSVQPSVYSGARSDYTISNVSLATIQLVDNRSSSPDGTDTLTNVEFVRFSDGTVAINSAPVLSNLGPSAANAEQVFASLDADVTIHHFELDAQNGSAGDYAGASATILRHGAAMPKMFSALT